MTNRQLNYCCDTVRCSDLVDDNVVDYGIGTVERSLREQDQKFIVGYPLYAMFI